MQEKEHFKWRRFALIAVLILGGLFVFRRYLLPCLLPFLLALATAWLSEPVVSWLNCKLHFKRSFASFLCLFVLVFTAVGVVTLAIIRLISQATDFIRELPRLFSGVPELFGTLSNTLSGYISSAPAGIREYLNSAIESIGHGLTQLPGQISAAALTRLSGLAGSTPGAMLFVAAYVIGTFFISRSFPEIRLFLIRQIPPRLRERARQLKRDILDGLGLWLKAQLTLMLVTFCLLAVTLSFMKVQYAVVIALIAAVIDSLPVFGTGIILLPWAAVKALGGNIAGAVSLGLLYLTVTCVRGFLEPKLVGASSGINPAAALLATYSGFRLVGVWGMLLFPAGLVVLKQLNDKGYISLWK